MSASNKGKSHGPKGISSWNKGLKMNDDFCNKVSEGKKGRTSPRKGIKLSAETKIKMSDKLTTLRWWTNGEKTVFCEKCPEGFVSGRKIKNI